MTSLRPKAPEYDMGPKCINCGRKLSNLDIGLHKKMINRGATEHLCVECLSEKIGVSVEGLYKKAEQFKKMGCVLFL